MYLARSRASERSGALLLNGTIRQFSLKMASVLRGVADVCRLRFDMRDLGQALDHEEPRPILYAIRCNDRHL
jgi:hypothetical protein